VKIRVYYEDTDIGGIVYHTNYLKFCERARSELFFHQGVNPGSINDGFVLHKIEANFLNTATLGDLLQVKTIVLEKKKTSFTLLQEIYKEDIKIFSAKVLLVYINNTKITKIPKHYMDIIEKISNIA
jgi:acyl-CoA thioester hydrolase